MKTINTFGKIFGLMAAAVAVFALVFGGCEDLVSKVNGKKLEGEVTITGTPKVGNELKAEANTNATGALAYAWQKQAADAEEEWVTIQGETEDTYTPVEDDIGYYVKVVVTAAGYGNELAKKLDETVAKEGDGDGEDPAGGPLGNSPAPLSPVTGIYAQPTEGNKTVFDSNNNSWSEEGTEWTWPLALNSEELTAYFAVVKGAGQTVTVGSGGDAAKVTVITETETDGTTPDDTKVVVAVDMEDVVFDGTDADGKGTRTFPLVVSEDGKAPVTVNVNLELTLPDVATIYHKEAGRWVKVQSPEITTANKNSYSSFNAAVTVGQVTDLQNAIVWVDLNATGGSGMDLVGGTTDGYSVYRIFIKKNELICKVILKFNTASHVALELYGSGIPGSAERNVSLNHDFNTMYHVINNVSAATYSNMGLITVYHKDENNQAKMLVLEKNITINGKKWNGAYFEDFEMTGSDGKIDKILKMQNLIYLKGHTLIMKPHSKITGFKTQKTTYAYNGIRYGSTDHALASDGLYMQGGQISGNTVGMGVIYYDTTLDTSVRFFSEPGFVVTDNKDKNGSAANKIYYNAGYTMYKDFDQL